MTRKTWLTIGALTLFPLAAGAFMLQSTAPDAPRSTEEGARLFKQVLAHIRDNAVDSLTDAQIYENAARGLVESLNDPYADLYSPAQLASFQRNTLGNNYGGVGMRIEDQKGLITVAQVFPNTPGEGAGVLSGDRILTVDTTDVTGLPLDKVSSLLTGKPGTKVTVAFGREGIPEPIMAEITRAVIRVPAVPFALHLTPEIGYVSLQRFNQSAAQDINDAIRRLRREGASSFVLDVRGNPGGDLEQALQIGDLFLPPGQEIARVRHRGKDPEVYRAKRPSIIDSLSFVVLVDGFSASASEIVAGTLQDHDRALVIGTPSFGKGLVQTLFPLQDGWAIKLTTGKWYTPSGRSIQGEHKQLADGRFVEFEQDTSETDFTKRQRPVFTSDAGRTVYGGGGVTPDMIIRQDTTTTAEREFLRKVGSKSQQIYLSIYGVALEQKGKTPYDFTVRPTWRDELYTRFQEAGVDVDRATFDAVQPMVDRLLEQRVASLAFGDSLAFRRSVRYDAQVRKAIEMLSRGSSQRELLALAGRPEVTKQ